MCINSALPRSPHLCGQLLKTTPWGASTAKYSMIECSRWLIHPIPIPSKTENATLFGEEVWCFSHQSI